MKNRLITGILFIILGGLIALGPQTIFPVCGIHTAEQASAQGTEKIGEQEGIKTGGQETMQAAEGAGEQAAIAMTTDSVMKCHWTAQAELGIGILIALLGAFLIIFQSKQIRMGLSLALGLNGILALLIPTVLIGVCGGAHMPCRSLALPALTVLSSVVIVTSAVNAVYLFISNRKGQVRP